MSKCATALSALPDTRRRQGAIRWSREASITRAFRSAASRRGKTLIHIQQSAPVVEQRPLAAYESLAAGGAR